MLDDLDRDERDELRHGQIGYCQRHRIRVIDNDCPQCEADENVSLDWDDAMNLADGNFSDE